MKQKITSILIFALLFLTACSSSTKKTAESSTTLIRSPMAEPTEKPAEPVETSAVQEGVVSEEFIAEGLNLVQADPGAFGAFLADYKTKNHLGIIAPEDFNTFYTGTLFNINLPTNAQPTGSDKVMISYIQFGDYEYIEENSGILLDVMA